MNGFLMSTRQNNVRISTYVAFNNATNGQIDIKHEKENKKLALFS